MMDFVLSVPEEVKMVEREYFNRWYSLKAYYMVTLVTSLPNLVSIEVSYVIDFFPKGTMC